MAVLKPLKVTIENYPAGRIEEFDAPNHPADPAFGRRAVRFSHEVYIEQDDFQEAPPHGFRRLAPGREVRLRYAYLVTCHDVVKDAAGRVVELRCAYDPDSRGGAGGRVKSRGDNPLGQRRGCVASRGQALRPALLSSESEPDGPRSRPRPTFHAYAARLPRRARNRLRSARRGVAVRAPRLFQLTTRFRPERLVFNRTASLRESPGKPPTARLDLRRGTRRQSRSSSIPRS